MHREASFRMVQLNSDYSSLSLEHLSRKTFQSKMVDSHISDPLPCEKGKTILTCGDSNPLDLY